MFENYLKAGGFNDMKIGLICPLSISGYLRGFGVLLVKYF
jgi:hypothetical protein